MRLNPFAVPPFHRRAGWCLGLVALILLPALGSARAAGRLRPDDIAWLRRDGFVLDTASLAHYRKLGRKGMLDAQLSDRVSQPLPPDVASMINAFPAVATSPTQLMMEMDTAQQHIRAIPPGPDQVAAKKDLQDFGNQLQLQVQQAEMLQAVYGPNQLKEQLVWFWLNHFSVYAPKGRVRWELGDYTQNAIRPHALGKFRDLLIATLQSPAMLEFLDNNQNAKGHVNENYARELMELHTLGVGSGYSQRDVQQLALILTGVGIAPANGKPEKFNPKLAPLVVRNGMFEFNPQRHDFSDKVFLGHTIKGTGFDEVSQAIDLIVQQPACADFISHQLAEYFLADSPPPALVKKMSRTFERSNGDIAKVMRTMIESREWVARDTPKFNDPMRFVAASMRLAFNAKPVANALPLVYWLNQLDEPLFGRITPDGWPLDGTSWSSSGQLTKRFDIARAIGNGNNLLFTPAGSTVRGAGFPMLTTRLYYDAIEPYLSPPTHEALAKATSQLEWNSFLLASPEVNYR